MKKNTYQTGKRGEEIALRYLRDLGYQILATNYKATNSEIDIVALHNKELVALEVKCGSPENHLEENLTLRKRQKIEHAVHEFIFHHRMPQFPIRFEVLAITFPNNTIQHFQQEFFDF